MNAPIQPATLPPCPDADDLLRRFWSKVAKSDGCWIFTGCTASNGGYGRLHDKGAKVQRAHRVSWLIHFGPIPDGMLVLHKCDRPPCVRPDHLFLGTQRDNIQDMLRKGRGRPPQPPAQHAPGEHLFPQCGTRLSEFQVREIFALRGRSDRASIAKNYGISVGLVSRIWSGATWAHLGLRVPGMPRPFLSTFRGEAHPRAKLTDDDVLNIRARLARGDRRSGIARDYRVSSSLVRFIELRRVWTHLGDDGRRP